MKVLYVNSLYPPDVGGGAEVALAAMVQGFRRRGQQVAVLSTHAGGGVLRELVDGVPVYRMANRNIYPFFPPQARPAWQRSLWHAIDSANRALNNRLDSINHNPDDIKDLKDSLSQ